MTENTNDLSLNLSPEQLEFLRQQLGITDNGDVSVVLESGGALTNIKHAFKDNIAKLTDEHKKELVSLLMRSSLKDYINTGEAKATKTTKPATTASFTKEVDGQAE